MTIVIVMVVVVVYIYYGKFRSVPRPTLELISSGLLTGVVLVIESPIGNLPAPSRLLELLQDIPSAVPSLLEVAGAKVQLTELAVLEVIPFIHRAPTAVLKFLFLTAALMPVTLFPFPPIHLSAIAALRLVITRLDGIGLLILK